MQAKLPGLTRIRCDQTPAWLALQRLHAQRGASLDLRQQFAADASRFTTFSQSAPHVFVDLSKNLIDGEIADALLALARDCGVEQHRDAMFAGALVNQTEQRAVKHWLLRCPPGGSDPDLGAVHATLDAMLQYAEAVRADAAITDIVNIGIGGSDLGPQMAVLALDSYAMPGKRLHFVSNVDGHELAGPLEK